MGRCSSVGMNPTLPCCRADSISSALPTRITSSCDATSASIPPTSAAMSSYSTNDISDTLYSAVKKLDVVTALHPPAMAAWYPHSNRFADRRNSMNRSIDSGSTNGCWCTSIITAWSMMRSNRVSSSRLSGTMEDGTRPTCADMGKLFIVIGSPSSNPLNQLYSEWLPCRRAARVRGITCL